MGDLAVEGELERWLEDLPAVEVEDRFAAGLAAARGHDSHLGGASIGPHRSDLVATDAANGEPARLCSTGRQKAFLCAIVLAEARLRRQQAGDLPILLLDEATAHLDPGRRADLFDALIEPRFVVTNRIAEGAQAMVEWDFTFRIRRFRPSHGWSVHGVSHLRFAPDGRLSHHRDYWDTGDELYAKLPGIGPIVRFLKRRMA